MDGLRCSNFGVGVGVGTGIGFGVKEREGRWEGLSASFPTQTDMSEGRWVHENG